MYLILSAKSQKNYLTQQTMSNSRMHIDGAAMSQKSQSAVCIAFISCASDQNESKCLAI